MLSEQKLQSLLLQKQKTLSVAESCSGGLLSDHLTNVPGSSEYFYGGVIAYANATKVKLLKVPTSVLKKHGAVSEPVATLMAQNVRSILKTDIGVAITGIAGPSGGSKAKPVGTTYIAIADNQKTVCEKFLFQGNRLQVKSKAVNSALQLLLLLIEK